MLVTYRVRLEELHLGNLLRGELPQGVGSPGVEEHGGHEGLDHGGGPGVLGAGAGRGGRRGGARGKRGRHFGGAAGAASGRDRGRGAKPFSRGTRQKRS